MYKLYIAEELTKGFQDQCVGAMIDLCRQQGKKRDFNSMDQCKEKGQHALRAQLELYFVMQDFIPLELRDMKAYLAVSSRALQQQSVSFTTATASERAFSGPQEYP